MGALGSRQVRRRGKEGGEWCSLQKLIQNDNVVFYLERKIIILALSLGGLEKGKLNKILAALAMTLKEQRNPSNFGEGERAVG